jgi:hypothetical protein
MTPAADYLYARLPAIYRIRDAEQGFMLRALLRVIGEQADILEDDISRLYDNWFIETCEDRVVPYIGDLLGYLPLHNTGGGARGHSLSSSCWQTMSQTGLPGLSSSTGCWDGHNP